jgi:hypothetical protein
MTVDSFRRGVRVDLETLASLCGSAETSEFKEGLFSIEIYGDD